MAFGKSVFAKALDLVETVFREFLRITATDQIADHLLLEFMDGADMAERGHRAAQLVGFVGREFRSLDGDPHRLFLKQGNAEGFSEDGLKFVLVAIFRKGIFDVFRLHPPALQIGMHHLALDRPGTNDRDLDHQIIKRARLQARQHVHLGAALDLEYAERFAPAQHVVDCRHLARNGRKLPAFALVQLDQIETFPDAAQHAQRQHVDLHHPDFVDVILVPFDEGAILHRGVADRHIFIEPVLGQHVAADMLGQMTRKFDQFGRQLHRAMNHGVLGIEAGLPDLHLVEAVAPASPDRIGQQSGDVFGQAQRLADVADRTARPVMNDGGHDRGTVAAIAIEHILHHLFAARMFEIDVDIGRLAALLGEKPLEQKIDLDGIDGGDPQHETHGRIGRRSPALTQDVLRARIAHDVMNGQKIMRVTEFFDQRQFLLQGGAQFFIDALREIFRDPLPGKKFQVLLCGLARRHRLVGIAVFQFVQRKADAAGEPQRLGDRIGIIAKQPDHLGSRFQMPLGVGLQQAARFFNGRLLADAADDILQHPAFAVVVQHIIGGKQRHADCRGNALQFQKTAPVVAAMKRTGGEPHAIGARATHRLQHPPQCLVRKPVRRHQHQQQPFAEFPQIIEAEAALAFVGREFAFAEQTAEPAIGGAVARIGQNVRRAVDEDETRPDQQFRPGLQFRVFQFGIGPHHAGQRIAVGDPDGRQAVFACPMHIFLRMGGAAQKREIGGDADLDIVRRWLNAAGRGVNADRHGLDAAGDGHANNPCMNQCGCTALPSSCTISRS